MTRSRRVGLLLAVAAVAPLTGCGGDDPSATSPPGEVTTISDATSAPGAASTYVTRAFSMPFEVAVPASLPQEPSIDEPSFVTWESATPKGPAVRFLAPVSVFRPGSTSTTAPPDDYLGYLLAQEDHGATFGDQTDTTVGGLPATLVTAIAAEPIEGSLGCPRADMSAGDCFGLQPDLTLRLAVIDAGDQTLLAWVRHSDDAGDPAEVFASFETMLKSLRFRKSETPTTDPAAVASPIDGVWATTISLHDLESSPLLYDPDEVNDENWGSFTFTFERGRFTLDQTNAEATSSYSGTFEVDGDILSMTMEGVEHFEMRWSIDGDQLTLTRDDALGTSPTPWVMGLWARSG